LEQTLPASINTISITFHFSQYFIHNSQEIWISYS
jgi:hypothetical protein